VDEFSFARAGDTLGLVAASWALHMQTRRRVTAELTTASDEQRLSFGGVADALPLYDGRAAVADVRLVARVSFARVETTSKHDPSKRKSREQTETSSRAMR